MKANRPTVELLIDFGHQRGLTPSQVALAWLLAQRLWIVPIPGTTKPAHLNENLTVADLQFSPGELSDLINAISKIRIERPVYGSRAEKGCQLKKHNGPDHG